MKQPYLIPAAMLEHCYEVKKSKFIARVYHAEDRAAAMAALALAQHDYPDARHHCWAYLLGDPRQPSSAAFSDDGEPSGTAGKPILNVLNHRGIGDIMVVIIRYFGGIKLGAGGLVRAYSSSTQQAIERLSTVTLVPKAVFVLHSDYAAEPELRRFIDAQGGAIDSADYGLELRLVVSLPLSAEADLQHFLAGRKGISLQQAE
ncbi:putative YigZ family protein [Sinobacterium caligoides]|uniref:Putative YigZ family protein n=1 Tax=Sinobacterium caligoides TaxID=933926 RepID=A0A3N2DZ62_9GAMM|nr:YigZ family protein [Sinobacterium caligoides]ROS05057.1 putative YigZ family protein [Sinobacterium caligoides]